MPESYGCAHALSSASVRGSSASDVHYRINRAVYDSHQSCKPASPAFRRQSTSRFAFDLLDFFVVEGGGDVMCLMSTQVAVGITLLQHPFAKIFEKLAIVRFVVCDPLSITTL